MVPANSHAQDPFWADILCCGVWKVSLEISDKGKVTVEMISVIDSSAKFLHFPTFTKSVMASCILHL